MENPPDTPMDVNETIDLSDDDINKGSDDIIHIENQECMPVLMDDEIYQNKLKLAIVLILFIILITAITTMTFATKDDFGGISPAASVYSYEKSIKQQRKTPKCKCDQLHDTKDTIKTGKDVYMLQQRRNINELAFLSSSHYRMAYGNRCFTGHTDYIDDIFKLSLFHPNISDNGTLLFEFGLSFSVEYVVKDVYDYQMLTVKAFRCKYPFGICLEVSDEISSKIDVSVFKQTPEWIQGHITMGLQSSRFMLISENQNIYVGSKLNMSRDFQVWPVFGIYNSHLINMSFTIHSKDSISFNRTSLDPHLFISDDNLYTIKLAF